MRENIFIISEVEEEEEKFKGILDSDQYDITRIPFNGKVKNVLKEDSLCLILADFDLVRNQANLFYDMQQSRSKACLIFYGNDIDSEELSVMLHHGIYAFIPRKFLPERLRETVLGGLENRRAFIEILNMMDDLKDLNTRIEIEKESLKKRNQELSFINRLSSEISYDVNWDRLIQRMIDAGLDKTLEYRRFGLLFKMGQHWELTLHMEEPANILIRDKFVSDIIEKVNTDFDQDISETDINFDLIPSGCSATRGHYDIEIIPLKLAGKTLGFILYEAGDQKQTAEETIVLIDTLANMLSLSLKNAQEYYRLKEESVTDGLTGVYNRKGLFEFLNKELARAKRYKKPISFIMIDMDDLKRINDSLGHQAGDYALWKFAAILKKTFRQPDIIPRFGGDEFSILLPETELSDAHSIMERIMKNLEKDTLEWDSYKFKLRMSYGISNSNELNDQGNSEELIRLADSRLYLDKTH